MNKSHEHARLLIEKAAEDLYVLERLITDASAPEAVIGFHAQQAAEKLFKAVLTNRGIIYHRTHDLTRLVDMLLIAGMRPPPDVERLHQLGRYAVDFRYERLPEEAVGAPSLDRQWVIQAVRDLMRWAQTFVSEEDNR